MDKSAKIYVAGHRGLVGSAICRRLEGGGFEQLVVSDIGDFDLTDPRATDAFFADQKPAYVFLAAAKVGGINANDSFSADFIRINLQIQTNVIDAAHRHGVTKLMFCRTCLPPPLLGPGGSASSARQPGNGWLNMVLKVRARPRPSPATIVIACDFVTAEPAAGPDFT